MLTQTYLRYTVKVFNSQTGWSWVMDGYKEDGSDRRFSTLSQEEAWNCARDMVSTIKHESACVLLNGTPEVYF